MTTIIYFKICGQIYGWANSLWPPEMRTSQLTIIVDAIYWTFRYARELKPQ